MKTCSNEQLVIECLRRLTSCRIVVSFYHDFLAMAQAFSWQLAGLFALLAILEAIGNFQPALDFWLPQMLLLVMVMVSLLYALVMAWKRPANLSSTARDLDRCYGLEDLIGTACCVVQRQQRSLAAKAVIAAAAGHLQNISARQYLPLRWDNRLGAIVLVVLTAMILICQRNGVTVWQRLIGSNRKHQNNSSQVASAQPREDARQQHPKKSPKATADASTSVSPTHNQQRLSSGQQNHDRQATAKPTSKTNPSVDSTSTRPKQPGQSTRPKQSGQSTRPKQLGQSTRPKQPGQSTRPKQPGQSTRPKQPGQSTRPKQSGQSTRPKQPGQSKRQLPQQDIQSGSSQRQPAPSPGQREPSSREQNQPERSRPRQEHSGVTASGSQVNSDPAADQQPRPSKKDEPRPDQQPSARNLQLAKNDKTHKGDLDSRQPEKLRQPEHKDSSRSDSRTSVSPSRSQPPALTKKKSAPPIAPPRPGKRPGPTGAAPANNDGRKSKATRPKAKNVSERQAGRNKRFVQQFIKPLFGEGSKWISQQTLRVADSTAPAQSDKAAQNISRYYRFTRQAEKYIHQKNIPEDYRMGVKRYFQLVRPGK